MRNRKTEMAKDIKTNAMRILDALGIEYKVHSYEVDEEHLDAVHAAACVGFETERIYKTIVMKNNTNNLFVFCLPADFDISLKKARAITGSKDIDLLKMTELQKYTGYIRGGCSPLGMIRKYPTYILDLAELEETICVSAGVRGTFLEVKPDELLRAAEAEYRDFS